MKELTETLSKNPNTCLQQWLCQKTRNIMCPA